MTAQERRRMMRWTLGSALLLAGGATLCALMPHAIGAQTPTVPPADELALNESRTALTAARSQVAAMSGLPPEATQLVARISAAVQAQEREVLAGNEQAARQRHEQTTQALKRLGLVLQRQLAPAAEVEADITALAAHFERLSERHHLLAGLAAESGRPVVDLAAVAQAEIVAQSALNSGSIQMARTSLAAYLTAIEGLEDALFLRSHKLAP